MRHVASATNEVAGDGTTTATVLAQAIVRHGIRNVAAGADPMALRRGIERAVEQAVAPSARRAVAGDHDPRAARAGRDDLGRRRGDRPRDRRRDREGRQRRRAQRPGRPDRRASSWSSPTGCASSAAGSRRTWSPTRGARRPCSTIRSSCSPTRSSPRASASLPVLEQVAQTGKPLLVIAEMVEGDALQTLVTNKLRGFLTSVAVVTPEFGERRTRVLEDLAVAHRRRARDRGSRPDPRDDQARSSSGRRGASSSTR